MVGRPIYVPLVVASVLRNSIAQELPPCINGVTGALVDGVGLEFGQCVPAETSFFPALEASPTSSNGLQVGAPADVIMHLFQPSRNASASSTESSQPLTPGLPYPVGGIIVLDFSREFQYSATSSWQSIPDTNSWLDLGIADGNKLFGGEDCFERRKSADVVCANWTSAFGETENQIIIKPLSGGGLSGERAAQLGIKHIHVRPALGIIGESFLYRFPSRVCTILNIRNEQYCQSDADCSTGFSCMDIGSPKLEPVRPSVTVSVYDAAGNMAHQVTQSREMESTPRYAIYSTNAGLTTNSDLVETIDWQDAPAEMVLNNSVRPSLFDSFATGAPYAPRFILFLPNDSGAAYPHPTAQHVAVEIFSDVKGIITHGGVPIASVSLIQPEGGDGSLLADGAGVLDQSTDFGGTLLHIPIRTGKVGGVYAVQILLTDGSKAISRTVVGEGVPLSDDEPALEGLSATAFSSLLGPFIVAGILPFVLR